MQQTLVYIEGDISHTPSRTGGPSSPVRAQVEITRLLSASTGNRISHVSYVTLEGVARQVLGETPAMLYFVSTFSKLSLVSPMAS